MIGLNLLRCFTIKIKTISELLTRNMSDSSSCVRWIFNCHKWYPTREEWLLASSSIQAEEKDRVGRFFFKRDAKNCMAGRLLMRKFLTVFSGLPWQDIQISRAEHGKPYLANIVEPPLNFNISHHGNYAILAGEVGDFLIGTDIMTVEYRTGENLSEFLRIMDRQLSIDEWKLIKNQEHSEYEVNRLFYRIWCLKESYIKAIGSGLTESLQDLSFDLKDLVIGSEQFSTSTKVIVKGEKLDNWMFQEIMIDEDTFAAVAVSPKKLPLVSKFHELNFSQLINEAEKILPHDEEYCTTFFCKQNFPKS